jgi:pimeloyl-ACP methyl ester carboxylesterase
VEPTTSRDGTRIAFAREGSGPSVVLVDGGFGHRGFGPNGSLAPLLAAAFTVFRYDRRGRGESGDTAPFAAEREIEDLDAVIRAAGGEVCVYGISSGAALALHAARDGLAISRLAVFEPPFVVDRSRPLPPADLGEQIGRWVAEGRRDKAARLFLRRGVGIPAPVVSLMRFRPVWPQMTATAHTLPYDIAGIGDGQRGERPTAEQWASVTQPVLVLAGGRSPTWMRTAVRALADVLPRAEHRVLDGQVHVVDGAAVAPPVTEFFQR